MYAGGIAAALFSLVATYSPPEFLGHFTVFVLAVFVGYYVISNVAHALHTPLMSETNAISGIILVGGILQVGSTNPAIAIMAAARRAGRQHQHLRWLPGHAPHAQDVPEGLSPDADFLTWDHLDGLIAGLYIIAGVLFILALAGLSKHETRQGAATSPAWPAWPWPWSPPCCWASQQRSARLRRDNSAVVWVTLLIIAGRDGGRRARSASGGPAPSR